MAFSEIARRYQMQLAAAGSLGLAYWYYRSRLREPSLAEEYNVRNRSGIRPAGSGSDAYLREQQAVASVIKNNSGGGDVDAAWEELHGAVFDAHRHSQFLADTLRQYESDVKVNPSRAREELKEAVEDARAHADYVANQVSAFASLAGFDASRLKNLPKSTHPFAGPPSSTKLA